MTRTSSPGLEAALSARAASDAAIERRRRPGARAAFLSYAWSMRVGSEVVVNRRTAPIASIDDFAPFTVRPGDCTIRPDHFARRWRTSAGDRWIGWHPSELPDSLPFDTEEPTL